MTDFIVDSKAELNKKRNLSISIMALSDDHLIGKNVRDYEKLCQLTNEGLYVQIMNEKSKADQVAR